MTNENFDIERDLTIAQLINKHLNDALSEEERLDLNSWLNQSHQNRELFESFILTKIADRKSPLDRYDTAIAITAINEKIKRINRTRTIRRWVAAAAFIPILLITAILLKFEDKSTQPVTPLPTIASADDVLPGNGSVIIRNEDGTAFHIANNSDTSFQVGNTLLQEQNGTVSLLPTSKESVEYHTLETNRGANHKVVLSDGSVVWLNASSSIRFPSKFEGAERRVQVSGEAFFEVEHNPQIPFIVEKDNVTIQVLGTTFNVNTYTPNRITTTLITGSVKLKNVSKEKTLNPGQAGEATLDQISTRNADLEAVMAWKNGAFIQRNKDLRTIMDEVSRWYNVDVKYPPDFGNVEGLTVEVSKKTPLSELLKMISISARQSFQYKDGNILMTY
jgi:transmembrane sensor